MASVNQLGHPFRRPGLATRPPAIRIYISGMMCRVEALDYVRCTSELLKGNVGISI